MREHDLPGRCYLIEADGEPVGQIYYNDIEERAGTRRVELDLWLRAERYTGRGYGTDALETLCRHLSEALAVEAVMVQPSARNPRAIRAYENVGFRRLALPLDEARALWGPNDYDDSVYMVKLLPGPGGPMVDRSPWMHKTAPALPASNGLKGARGLTDPV